MKYMEDIELAWKIGDWNLLSGLNLQDLKSSNFEATKLQSIALKKEK